MDEEAIDISSSSSRSASPEPVPLMRRDILYPAIQSVIAALGGLEDDVYVLGDEAYGCLKDLKKFWRKDDTDDDRTVARIFWDTRVLFNDLMPILLLTAGNGQVEHKCAIACLDLITAMTWPIDIASELMELDEQEEEDKKADYTTLLLSHLHYKAAILGPGVLEAVVGIILPCLSKEPKDRTDRDGQIINVALFLIRNLAFIKDPPQRVDASSDHDELSQLQSKLVLALQRCNILELLLTLASNAADDPLFNSLNTLLLETFYLLFRAVKPSGLVADQASSSSKGLASLLAIEDNFRTEVKRHASTRHSRFGTSIAFRAGNEQWILNRQKAITAEAGGLLDLTKKKQKQRGKLQDDLSTFEALSYEARIALQQTADTFVEACFNPFLTSLLKDIRAERTKVTEKDNLRLLFVTKWFMEYFLALHNKEKAAKMGKAVERWTFDHVADIVERSWITWMLKRMRNALEEKPKQWTELQAGLECVTHLLLLVDAMGSSADDELVDAAQALQHQLYYNGEILDLCFDSLKTYKEQSLAYLHATVHLGYVLLRMLEAWGKTKGEMYVQRKARKKKKPKPKGNANEEEGVVDAVVEDDIIGGTGMLNESLLTFEKYEAKFADEHIAHTLLTYLAQYQSFDSLDCMKRVVTLLHRQAVRVKAEGLFFKVSTLSLFRRILAEQRRLPKDQPYKDLLNLINFLLRKFFKAVAEDQFLVVEAFFPKNRGTWKQFSSWEPDVKEKRKRVGAKEEENGEELSIPKTFTWSQQVGIAVGCLVDADKRDLVDWTKEILTFVIGLRTRDVEEEPDNSKPDGDSYNDSDEDLGLDKRKRDVRPQQPPASAVAKFKDYPVPYPTNEKARSATMNSYLKLLWKLLKFETREQMGDELEWYVPRELFPDVLQTSLKTIDIYLEDPIDLDGKRPRQLAKKKRRRRARSVSASESEGDANFSDGEGERKRKAKRVKKKKEQQLYKSAALIEDSDAEAGDEEAFLAREREQRARYELKAAASAAGAAEPRGGTKKKRASENQAGGAQKRRKLADQKEKTAPRSSGDESEARAKTTEISRPATSTPPSSPPVETAAKKPKSKPQYLEIDDENEDAPTPAPAPAVTKVPLFNPDSDDDEQITQVQPRRVTRIVISDDED